MLCVGLVSTFSTYLYFIKNILNEALVSIPRLRIAQPAKTANRFVHKWFATFTGAWWVVLGDKTADKAPTANEAALPCFSSTLRLYIKPLEYMTIKIMKHINFYALKLSNAQLYACIGHFHGCEHAT